MLGFTRRAVTIFALSTGLLASAASAQGTGSEGYFTLFNNTGGNVLVGFYTNDGSGWSDNWLDVEVRPGESAEASFLAVTGACDQTFAAGWLGEDSSEIVDDAFSIDICAASNVYLGDNEISYD